jgi:hypothetical protein
MTDFGAEGFGDVLSENSEQAGLCFNHGRQGTSWTTFGGRDRVCLRGTMMLWWRSQVVHGLCCHGISSSLWRRFRSTGKHVLTQLTGNVLDRRTSIEGDSRQDQRGTVLEHSREHSKVHWWLAGSYTDQYVAGQQHHELGDDPFLFGPLLSLFLSEETDHASTGTGSSNCRHSLHQR